LYAPGGVLAPAVRVKTAVPPALTDAGANEALAPAGTPVADRVTLSALPDVTAVEIVLVTVPPCATETLVGLAAIEKSLRTVTLMLVVCVAEAPAPVMVRLKVPPGVLAPGVSVSVELAPAVTLVGLNVAVAPAGSPVTDSATLCAAPAVIAVEIVLVALPPAEAETAAGLALIEKSLPTAPTVKLTAVVCVAAVPVPVTVRL
jgi:hypothetical protein